MTAELFIRAVRSLGGTVELVERDRVRVCGVPLGWRDRQWMREEKAELIRILQAEDQPPGGHAA